MKTYIGPHCISFFNLPNGLRKSMMPMQSCGVAPHSTPCLSDAAVLRQEPRFTHSLLRYISWSVCMSTLSLLRSVCIFGFALGLLNSASKLFPNHQCSSTVPDPSGMRSMCGVIPGSPFLSDPRRTARLCPPGRSDSECSLCGQTGSRPGDFRAASPPSFF